MNILETWSDRAKRSIQESRILSGGWEKLLQLIKEVKMFGLVLYIYSHLFSVVCLVIILLLFVFKSKFIIK
jgi:hypothetical protein